MINQGETNRNRLERTDCAVRCRLLSKKLKKKNKYFFCFCCCSVDLNLVSLLGRSFQLHLNRTARKNVFQRWREIPCIHYSLKVGVYSSREREKTERETILLTRDKFLGKPVRIWLYWEEREKENLWSWAYLHRYIMNLWPHTKH